MTKNNRETNYYEIPVPDGDDFEEWSYNERRAYILEKIIEKGDPNLVSRTKMGEKFGVSQQQISKDIHRISKSILDNTDTAKFALEIETAFKKMKREAIEKEDYNLYRKTMGDWSDWLFDMGKLDKAPEKHEVKHDADEDIKDKTDELIKLVRENKDE